MNQTIKANENITTFILDNGFKMNGYDFYKNFGMTDLNNEWEEEVYVSLKNDGYFIDYPEGGKKNKVCKNNNALRVYIRNNH